jgi:hypothetical protein
MFDIYVHTPTDKKFVTETDSIIEANLAAALAAARLQVNTFVVIFQGLSEIARYRGIL